MVGPDYLQEVRESEVSDKDGWETTCEEFLFSLEKVFQSLNFSFAISLSTGYFNRVNLLGNLLSMPVLLRLCLSGSNASKYSSMDAGSWFQEPSVYPCGRRLC